MSIRDLIALGFGNLWQTKLRSILTILGVVIGIGALTSMISFGTGMQKNITDTFEENDLFTSMYITTVEFSMADIQNPNMDNIQDILKQPKQTLNDSILNKIREFNHVSLAYPEIIIPAKIRYKDYESKTRIQALPAKIRKYKPYDKLLAGEFYSNDSALGIVISWETLRKMGIIVKSDGEEIRMTKKDSLKRKVILPADSVIGLEIEVVSATLDIQGLMRNPFQLMNKSEEAFTEKSTSFPIIGILQKSEPFSTRNLKGGCIVATNTASVIPTLNFNNIWDILDRDNKKGQYASLYVRVDDMKNLSAVQNQIEEMDLHVFSIIDQISEIKRGFLIMDSILGAIGTVALLIAALGIINTMIMSILERRKEIGIMKSIGGSESNIRTIFFVEAGAIGFIGAIFGLILGWLFTRVANFVLNNYIIPEGEASIDVFYFPPWLILGAILFSIVISLIAGLYPAIRASRVDPVKVLRYE